MTRRASAERAAARPSSSQRAAARSAARRAAVLACALAALLLRPGLARGSAADAFENKVKPVSGQLYTKAGKLELAPSVQISMNDAFFSKYLVGARLGYHLTEVWSVALTGSYAFAHGATGSTTVCTSNAGCREALPRELYQVPGYVKYLVGAEVAFSPVYGKLNLFAEKALHFDLSIFAGADLVGYRDVLDATSALSGATPADGTSPGGHLGVGTRIFLGRNTALGLELKDVLYQVKGLPTGKLQNQLMAQAALSFFVPMTHRETP